MSNKADCYLENLLPDHFFERLKNNDFIRNYYPPFSQRESWEKLANHPLTAEIFNRADTLLTQGVPQLLYSDYCEFNRNGNRVNYETLFFSRRNALGILTLALCISGNKGKYMPRLMDYLVAILEEWTWCIPAHIEWTKDGVKDIHPTDLFASETAAILGTVYSLIANEIDNAMNGVAEYLRKKTLERTVYSVLRNVEQGITIDWWFTDQKPANWTIWCVFNNLVALTSLEKDNEKLHDVFRRYLQAASRFAYCYDDDGYCDEGPSYYMQAGGMLFRVLDLLDKIQPGSVEKIYQEPKIRAIFEFIVKVRVGDYAINFGDAQPRINKMLSTLLPCGIAIGSDGLKAFGRNQPLTLNGRCGDLLREPLAALFDIPYPFQAPADDELSFSCFPGRLAVTQNKKFTVSLKAGNNAEAHNHNDLGHFSLFFDQKPVIVDAGTGTYAKVNFSPERYTLWYTRGAGHNAPVFGSFEQIAGREYKADFVTAKADELVCDLSSSYPPEAGVKKFLRSIILEDKSLIVRDSIELEQDLAISLTLFTPINPVVKDHKIILGNVVLELEQLELESIEEMPELLHGRVNYPTSIWNGTLKAIRLTGKKNDYRMIFTEAGN